MNRRVDVEEGGVGWHGTEMGERPWKEKKRKAVRREALLHIKNRKVPLRLF